MPGQRIGSMISAGFGLIYLLVNTSSLPPAVAWSVRALGVIAAAAVLIAVWRRGSLAPAETASARTGRPPGGSPFGRGYWVVVVLEAVALFGGVRLLTGPLGHPDGGIAWVTFVVGVHFFALAGVFRQPYFNWLGGAVTLCGVVGLVLVFADAPQASIDVVAGVVPGALLLAFGWWGATSTRTEPLALSDQEN